MISHPLVLWHISPLHHPFPLRCLSLSLSLSIRFLNNQPLRLFCTLETQSFARRRAYLMHVSVDSFLPLLPLFIALSLFGVYRPPFLAALPLTFSLSRFPLNYAKCFTSVNSWDWEKLIIVKKKKRTLRLEVAFVDWGSCSAVRLKRLNLFLK